MDNTGFENALATQNQGQATSTLAKAMSGQRAQEVQMMAYMAKTFPRDEISSMNRIKTACSRKSLAEVAMYEYPRGGQKVTGPSIRLAEVLLQNWGNIKCGVIELDNTQGESKAMAYAWDLETNAYDEKIFTVKHIRDTKQGSKNLTDSRDIYEKVANEGSRRKRSCILAVIPSWVIDEAVEECEKTLKNNNGEPLIDRIRKLLEKFQTQGVTKEMIEKFMGYKVEVFTEKDGIKLQKIYTAIKDGAANREDYFEVAKPSVSDPVEEEFRRLKEENDKNGGQTSMMDGGQK